jgi:glycosyltransferase involved in cell wall biosynthesis
MGLYRILEECGAPTLIYHQLLAEEHRLWPGWESPYPGQEIFQTRIDLDRQEWDLADSILCGSTFVAQGLESLGVPPEKIRVVPYGIEISQFANISPPWDGHRPLRVLFLGRVSLGKGVQYLYEALKSLDTPAITARMVGSIALQEPYRRLLAERIELMGQVPHSEVIRHLAWADLLVHPSISEGSAVVNYEALAAGLPVITTPNAGSVVRDGVDGFIVPIRDSLALAQKIDLLARDPNLLTRMSQNARERVQEFSLERYGERLVSAILEELPPKTGFRYH